MESRVSTLEATVEQEARARAGMDEDMSDLRLKLNAQERMLKSLSKTQSDHTAKLRSIDNRLTGVETRLTGVETRLTGVETRLTSVEGTLEKVNVGVQTIIELLAPANDHGESGDSPN